MRAILFIVSLLLVGCGTTRTQLATEQLLMSNAVDKAIERVDFRPLSGKRIYLDTQYLTSSRSVTGVPNQTLGSQGIVNADYVVSSVRQQMLAAGCLLEDQRERAELVAEIRIGTLGTNDHSIVYGLPANNVLSSASSVLPNQAPLPSIPEISVAKRENLTGSAKVAIFAYSREDRKAVWQSGIETASSNAKDTWFFGIGPFQSGEIYKVPRFAGTRIFQNRSEPKRVNLAMPQEVISLNEAYVFSNPVDAEPNPDSQQGANPQLVGTPPAAEGAVVQATAEVSAASESN